MSLTPFDTFSLKARSFLVALDAVCKAHQVLLTVSGSDALQLWDLDTATGESWLCNAVEDRTVPTGMEDAHL